MIKSSLLYLLLLFALTSVAQQRDDYHLKNMETLAFYLREENYVSDHIYFYHSLLKKTESKASSEEAFSFTNQARPLDLYNYWEGNKQEQYHVLLTKVAYVLDKPIHFFSAERLADQTYISQTIPKAKIQKKDSIYHISLGFGTPEIDYSLHFYTPEAFDQKYPDLKNYFKTYDGLAQSPSLIVVQHNFNYGKVLFQKTSKMSISITRYFPWNKEQTLVFNYTLNYIHNFPPSFIGGSDLIIDKIREGIIALIAETQHICRTTEGAE